MARLSRYVLPGQPLHIIQRGHNRSAVFAECSDYSQFLEHLAKACRRYECSVHAYVLMTNHIHLLITPQRESGVGEILQALGREYTLKFNRRRCRTGGLWEGRYRATLVDTERYLLTCYRYIELNPVRAGIVAHPIAYRWSSHHANALGDADELITPHDTYWQLGGDDSVRRAAYTALFASVLDESTLQTIRDSTNKGWALGDAAFRERVARITKRRATPLQRGGAH
jgi:putative transposase